MDGVAGFAGGVDGSCCTARCCFLRRGALSAVVAGIAEAGAATAMVGEDDVGSRAVCGECEDDVFEGEAVGRLLACEAWRSLLGVFCALALLSCCWMVV